MTSASLLPADLEGLGPQQADGVGLSGEVEVGWVGVGNTQF